MNVLHQRPVADKNAQFLGNITQQGLRERVQPQPTQPGRPDALALRLESQLHQEVGGGGAILRASATMATEDINGIVFIAMMEAQKSVRDNLKSVMGEMKAINKEKEHIRAEMVDINKALASYQGLAGAHANAKGDYPADRNPGEDDWKDADHNGSTSVSAKASRVNGETNSPRTRELEAQIASYDAGIQQVQSMGGDVPKEWTDARNAAQSELDGIRAGGGGPLAPGESNWTWGPPQTLEVGIEGNQSLSVTASNGQYLTKSDLDILKSKIENEKDRLKGTLDSKGEEGEMMSMRVQQYMDRLSKIMSTLTSVLKKIDDGTASVVSNVK